MQASLAPRMARFSRNAIQRITAGTRLPLVASHCRSVEIRTASALHQVSGGRCSIAYLSGCTCDNRPRQDAILPTDGFVCGKIRIANHCPDAQPAVFDAYDRIEPQTVDVHKVLRCFNLELHEVEQIGSTCYDASVRSCRQHGDGVL